MPRFLPASFDEQLVPGSPPWTGPLYRALNAQGDLLSRALIELQIANGAAPSELKEVIVTGPSPTWIAPTFTNSWVNFGSVYETIGYRAEPGGRVRLQGLAKSGTITTSMFTLPAGYRPAAAHYQIVVSNNAAGVLDLRADGSVIPQIGTNAHFSLEGVSFDALSPAALPTPPSWPQNAPQIQTQLARVVGVHLVGFRALDAVNTSTLGMGSPVVEWEQTGDRAIKLRTVWGLQPGARYRLQLLLLGG